jgi:hypothetical protein
MGAGYLTTADGKVKCSAVQVVQVENDGGSEVARSFSGWSSAVGYHVKHADESGSAQSAKPRHSDRGSSQPAKMADRPRGKALTLRLQLRMRLPGPRRGSGRHFQFRREIRTSSTTSEPRLNSKARSRRAGRWHLAVRAASRSAFTTSIGAGRSRPNPGAAAATTTAAMGQ